VFQRVLDDKLIRGLLLIHNLHPHSLETRLRQALEKVRPYMESHGGNVELVELNAGIATLRLQGTCKNCRSSAVTLELAVQNAIEEACPDLMGFRVEGSDSQSSAIASPSKAEGQWIKWENFRQLHNGEMIRMETPGLPVLVCKLNETLYAYNNRCPMCNSPMHLGTLRESFVSCQEGHCYDLQRPGQSPTSADLQLEPIPLIVEDNVVKVLMTNGQRPSARQVADKFETNGHAIS
jgi:Fe-S cluster biogenesis protein NfuA/nitrite reductase/ring-hydroxylating ferredoxin subunit